VVEIQVTVGRFSLQIGAPHGTRVDPAPEVEPEQADALADAFERAPALEGETAAAAVETAVARAEEVTGAVERTNDLVTALSKGLTLDPKALEQQVDALLDVADRVDREGRFDDEIRLARSLVALLALIPRWIALVGVLRRAASAAAAIGDRAGESWAHHELGSFALGAEDANAATGHLAEALRLRRELGDETGMDATLHNMQFLPAVTASSRRNGTGSSLLRRSVLLPVGVVLALLLAAGVAIGAWQRTDESDGDDAAIITASTDAKNRPPSARAVEIDTNEDEAESWSPDADDPDGDAPSCTIRRAAKQGTATVEKDCSGGNYTPKADYNGADSFTYLVTDGRGGTATATAAVTVDPVNDAPVAEADTIPYVQQYRALASRPITIPAETLLANDTDTDGDELTIASVSTENGRVLFDGTNVLYAFAGEPFSFQYTVTDSSAVSEPATVTIVPETTTTADTTTTSP
jgi:hypothetical protein